MKLQQSGHIWASTHHSPSSALFRSDIKQFTLGQKSSFANIRTSKGPLETLIPWVAKYSAKASKPYLGPTCSRGPAAEGRVDPSLLRFTITWEKSSLIVRNSHPLELTSGNTQGSAPVEFLPGKCCSPCLDRLRQPPA